MTLTKRVVVCLDVRGERVVKGTRFVDLVDVGEPVALAEQYERDGADEIVFLDIAATPAERKTMLDVARSAADRLFIPLTIGGGMRSVDDMARALRAGADKVSLNSAAVREPTLISDAAMRFGAQCVVASIDAKRNADGRWEVFTAGGRTATGIDAVEWAQRVAALGAGEILLTSIDRDGGRCGYDLDLTRTVTNGVDVPVIASGGAGSPAHVVEVLRDGGADAALVAGILHSATTTVAYIKEAVARAGLLARDTNIETVAT
jgi:cyclase